MGIDGTAGVPTLAVDAYATRTKVIVFFNEDDDKDNVERSVTNDTIFGSWIPCSQRTNTDLSSNEKRKVQRDSQDDYRPSRKAGLFEEERVSRLMDLERSTCTSESRRTGSA
uniref:Uncharacterized protein n=1 Tax=Vespula pensylvanica TaxID=30213 RepID=A0A834P669_VESPE|nr:hypothetical protein H0235_006065 [Vespula pensylvanica]